MTDERGTMRIKTIWHNCYDEGWKDVICPEAFAHPAKMSYGLLKRILAHAQEQGWLKGVILDPFGGIGSTGIMGAYEGYQVVCVELEQKFVDLAEQNFKLHDNAWQKFGNPRPIILQGDSRRLCEVVEKADCIISSPPFQEAQTGGGIAQKGYHNESKRKGVFDLVGKRAYMPENQGQTPGQLGAMKPGNVDCILSSPPYNEKGHPSLGHPEKDGDQFYSKNPRNLGNLKSGDVDCVISSPPYRDPSHGRKDMKDEYFAKIGGIRKHCRGEGDFSKGNMYCSTNHDTFWSAAKIIVEQCHQILKPGGMAIWVVKSFVRNKKIVDFPGDWQRLCEAAGFKTVCIHHAMLVKETKHKTLFGHTEVKRTERKSFFRRLAESKGSPKIDFEVVLCMQRQDGSICRG